MFSIAALIPSPPALVPELCGGHPTADPEHPAAQVPALREAVLTAARALARDTRHWTVVGVSSLADRVAGDAESRAAQGPGAPAPEPLSGRRAIAVHGPAEMVGTFQGGGDPDTGRGSSTLRLRETTDSRWAFGAAVSSHVVSAFGVDSVGTFRGFGVDVRVALSDSALRSGSVADPELPLSVLVGGWVRGQVAAAVSARAWLVDDGASMRQCTEVGAMLRRELDADPEPGGVLVIADGANTLSRTAPGYLDPRAEGVQDRIDTALDDGDCAVLAGLDVDLCAGLGVSGRAAYQVLAGLFGAQADLRATGASDGGLPVFGTHSVETLYRAAPFGVGYHVSVWRPGARR
ncbi:hypothetical protein [Nocardia alni]|uniref:hypothetical protein n=1 Tax=Nocardia alni TaxID=2815723 RepID=UPI001C23B947|nr:hypothetical protein [Nocardia alni]